MSIPNLEEFSSSSEDDMKLNIRTKIHQRVVSQYDSDDLWRQPQHYELTEDEQFRAEQRKENNKRAAKKSREKKKGRLDFLEKRAKELRSQRQQLMDERKRLDVERARLKSLLLHHANTCPGVRESLKEKMGIY